MFFESNSEIAHIVLTYNLCDTVFQTKDKLGNQFDYFLIALDIQDVMRCFKLFNITEGCLTEVEVAWFLEREICPSEPYALLNKYIKVSEIRKLECNSYVIIKKHNYYEHCDDPDCNGGCPLCTLSVCKDCAGYEGTLTTNCPEIPYPDKRDAVYANQLDYRYGKWRNNIITEVMLWHPEEAIPNEIKYLQELLCENAPYTILNAACQNLKKWICCLK